MGLIENELSELRALIKDFREGKVELETYKATLAGYRETHHRVQSILKIMALVGQYGHEDEQQGET
jgi:hypothetical protein